MRKVLSLFCAALMVLSASAFPQAKSIANAKNIAELKATLPTVKAQMGSKERLAAAPASTVKKAPAVVADGKIVADYAQGMYYSADFTETTAYWNFGFFNGSVYAAEVLVNAIADDQIAGTYTIAEGNGDVVVAAGDTATITSGTLTITYAAPNYHFSLSATCDNGNTYTLELDYAIEEFIAIDYMRYYYLQLGYGALLGITSINDCLIELDDAPFYPTGKTIEVVCPNASFLNDFTESMGALQVYNDGDEYYASIAIYSDHVESGYNKDNIYYDYTFLAIYTDTVEDGYIEVEFKKYASDTVTVKVVGDTTMVDASLMGKDGNIYHIVMKHYIPTPTSFVNVVFDNGKAYASADDYGNLMDFTAENDTYKIGVNLNWTGVGTYTQEDMNGLNNYDEETSYLVNVANRQFINIIAATMTVADDYSFTAQFISTDAVQYNITFKATETALDNTTLDATPAQKLIRDGQLVIIKGGVEYNALGVQL